jgi:hypothetical protein
VRLEESSGGSLPVWQRPVTIAQMVSLAQTPERSVLGQTIRILLLTSVYIIVAVSPAPPMMPGALYPTLVLWTLTCHEGYS